MGREGIIPSAARVKVSRRSLSNIGRRQACREALSWATLCILELHSG